MAKMIVVIGPDAEQNRQFAEQMKYPQAHELEASQDAATPPAESQAAERLPSPVRSQGFELERPQEAQQGRDLDLIPGNQPGGALDPREPEVRHVDVTPLEGGSGGGGNPLPGPAGQQQQRPGPQLEEPEDEVEEWKPPSHEFGHSATDDPRQMLLTEMNKDIKDFQSAWEYRTANAEQQAQPQPAPDAPHPQPGTDILARPDVAGQVQVTQEREPGSNTPAPNRETVIDAEFRPVDPDGPQGPMPSQRQPTHRYSETHVNAETPASPAQRQAAIEQARADIAADKTVVVTATKYSPEVKQLMEEARAQGHRVQVAVIGEQQQGQVNVRPEHLPHVPELSKDSHYVSVYAQNDAGKYNLHATNYNDQAKVTPGVAPEVGNQLARGIEAKGLHSNVAVQQVDGFKDSHPAATKMQAQPSRGMDYQ
ncbi:hypothetical protein D3875_03540 [Deinococcus cavernae]|uniref:Uncharacterized protein n=1 Tax=Deinococcus cavernae TaxID=2320857 RepID=A0A418VEV7_9DEIO|nr:hypothetical protein [Deinococcus cavernae]RJF74627.1 hypothetical protein D3875_03540 [Deinococcus cavernae]